MREEGGSLAYLSILKQFIVSYSTRNSRIIQSLAVQRIDTMNEDTPDTPDVP